MKKGLKIFLILAVIIIVLIIILSAFFSIKGNKKAIDAEYFIKTTTDLGYTSSKVTTSSSVIDSYSAKKENCKIDFYVTSSELAEKNFNRIKRQYETLKDDSSVETSVSVNNYSKYTLSTNETYMIVTRIENTIMFTQTDKDYKDSVKDTFDQLGY